MLENMQDISLQSSHEAGVDITESKMLIKFAPLLLMNLYEYVGNGKDSKEAFDQAMKDAKDVVLSYGRAAFLKDIVSNSPNETIQSFDGDLEVAIHLEKTGVECYKIFIDYGSQKIDDDELSCRLLHTGTKILGTKAMAVVGQTFIPIPVVGVLIGSFVGGVMSKTFYDVSLTIFKEAKLACQRRIEIEKECRESIRQLEMYQNQFNEVFERYFHGTIKFFNESFDELERVLCAGDADLAIAVNNKIQERMGQELLFDNKQECWEFITSRKEGWNFITSRGRTEI
ncbi:hypothetical protein ACR9NB_02275 [Helicobacter pylori]